MSWGQVVALAACAYGFKLLGMVIIGSRPMPAVVDRCLVLVPAALLSALVVKDVFSSGHDLVLDARAAGLAVAAAATWRRAPFIVVVGLAAMTTALLRQL